MYSFPQSVKNVAVGLLGLVSVFEGLVVAQQNLSYTPVIGVPDRVVERKPVTVLQQQSPDVFNMFILAMESIQNRDETDDESFFQIAGIHGFPFITWQYPVSAVVNPGNEYCTHGSVVFNTWHRPYLVLLEQTLQEEAVRIANQFSDYRRAQYLPAAQEVRLPYWDWASEETIPSIVSAPTVDVVKPFVNGTGGQTTIDNPLFSYMFQNSLPPDIPGNGEETIRGANANDRLSASFPSRQTRTLDVFTITDHNDFNFALEGIHNGIHVEIAGGMATISYSSFDPIFFLHHCNVDRLYAMYQALNPGQGVTLGRSGLPTLQLPAFEDVDAQTPLYPFRDGSGSEWTSDAIRGLPEMYDFGYSYPETPTDLTGEALSTFTTERINQLYGPDTDDGSFDEDSAGDNVVLEEAQEPNSRTEWSCNFVYNKAELPGSYRINVYINGGSGSNITNGSTPETGNTGDLVGVAPIFSKSGDSGGNIDFNYTVPLTPALIKKNIQLKPEETVPNLRDRLYWTLERVDNSIQGESRPVSDLTSLKVSVVSTVTDYKDSDEELPEIKRPLTYVAPVEGKPGAITSEEVPAVGEKAPEAIDQELVQPTLKVRRSAKLRYAKL